MKELQYVSVPTGGKAYCYFPYYCSTNTSIVFENLYLPVQTRTGGGSTFFSEGPGRFQGSGNGMMCGVPNVVDSQKNLSYEFWRSTYSSTLFKVNLPMPNGINGKLEVGNAYMKIDDVIATASTTYTGETITLTEQFHLFDHWYKGWSNWIMEGHCGTVSFYENGVLAARFIPYEDDNGVAGFYDENNQTMIYSMVDPWVAGPYASSVLAEPSKRALAATGETIDIVVTCENAWTVTGETFLTLSSTGDTGSTTITATAPSYTGTTARTDVLTFADTVTGDEVEVSIKQKKYTDGQPFYLGDNEVNEAYLGYIDITEAYLGDVLVFSASVPVPPAPVESITITIDDIDPCIVYDDGIGVCSDYDEVSYSIVQIDPSDDTELSVVATVDLERTGDGTNDPYVWSIASSTLPQGVTATVDDSDGWDLLIEGSFDTANTYVVKCDVTTPEDYKERWGYANDNGDYQLDLSTDVTLTPDFSTELMPLRTLTIEGVPPVPSDATHIEVTDDDKFGIEISWNDGEMDVETSVWTGDCWDDGGGMEGDCRITVNYVSEEEAIIIEADWEPYDGEGSGEYTIRMKAETDSCTVEEGDEGTYSLQWSANELSKTITFDGGTCTPS